MRVPFWIPLAFLPLVLFSIALESPVRSRGVDIPAGHAGSPLENGTTCNASCHGGGGATTAASFLSFDSEYSPAGSALPITVSGVNGFQLTILDESNTYAGTIQDTDTDNIVTTSGNGAVYAAHESAFGAPWTITWTPPASNVGPVHVYAVAMNPSFTFVHQVGTIQPANQAPAATFTATPTSGRAPLSVSFDASASSDPDGTIAGYAWDFGDGTSGSGVTTTHTYTMVNTYQVVLTVSDDLGLQAEATQDIEVLLNVGREPDAELPARFAIESVYPNPFNPSVTVALLVQQPGTYQIHIANAAGKVILRHALNATTAGRTELTLHLADNASGVYFVSALHERTGQVVSTKAVLLK